MIQATRGASKDMANNTIDPLQVPEGPITRQNTKRLREAMAGLV